MVKITRDKTSLVRLKLMPMIRSNLRTFLALVVISSVAIALLLALNNASDRLHASVDAFREAYEDPDVQITVERTDADVMGALSSIDGVQRVCTRLAYDASVRREDGRIVTLRLFTYDEGDFPKITVEGDADAPDGGITIAPVELFAARNDIHPGDSVTLLLGDDTRALTVSGIAKSPEAMDVQRDIYVWYDDIDFGYAYIGRDDLASLIGGSGVYNQIHLLTADGAQNEAVLSSALAVLHAHNLTVLDASDYEHSNMRKYADSMIAPIRVIANILPPIFFAVMLLFLYISLSQTIMRGRKTIGILRALGFRAGEVYRLYSAYALVITLLASVIGVIGGALFSELVYSVYARNMLVPLIEGGFRPMIAAIGVFASIATGQAATLILTGQIAKINAASAMRPVASDNAQTPLLLRTVFKHLSSMTKLMLATVLRKKQRLILSTVSLLLAAFMILLSISLMFSQSFILNHTFTKRMRYDAQVRFHAGMDEAKQAQMRALTQIDACDMAIVFTETVHAGGADKILMLCGLEKDATLVGVFDENYSEIPVPGTGIVLEKNVAGDLGIRAGDTVRIGETDTAVAAISAEDINYIQYCDYALAAALSGLETPNTAFCKIAEGVSQIEFLNAIAKIEGGADVTFCDKQYESGKSNMDLVRIAMTLIITSAIIMGFVIVYNTSLYSYTDWEREYAILRAEGFGIARIVRVSIAEVVFEYIVALAASLPMGLLASAYMLDTLKDQSISYPLAKPFTMCVVTALIMLLFVGYSFLVSLVRLKRMNMATAIQPK